MGRGRYKAKRGEEPRSGTSTSGAKGQAVSGRAVSWLGGRAKKVGSTRGTNQSRQLVRQRDSARRGRGVKRWRERLEDVNDCLSGDEDAQSGGEGGVRQGLMHDGGRAGE